MDTCATFALLLAAAVQFADVTVRSGITFKNEAHHTPEKYLLESMTGGVAMFDYDGDGRLDLYFANGAVLPSNDKSDARYWNRLYRNNGDGTFTDVTARAGVQGHSYGMGVAAGDYDGDRRPDLFVTNYGRNILYRNNGDGTFADVTGKAGVAGSGWSTGAMFVDYDRDGGLDLVVARYLEWSFANNPYCGDRKPGHRSYCHPDQFKPITHLLYHNNRDGTFTEVSAKAGLTAPGKGLGVAFHDFDRDLWPDLLIANDSFPQQLFRNMGNGTFEEIGLGQGIAYDDDGRTFAGMGVDFADYDNDGWPDVFVNALANQRYALFRNLKGTFDYASGPSGVGRATMTHSGWGAKFVDYDNDGWKDLFVGQGHVMDNIELTQPALRYLEPPLLLRNGRGNFHDVAATAGEIFRKPLAARGVAFGDLDNDGWIDVAINCNDRPPVILRNTGMAGRNWLIVDTGEDGTGVEVRVVTASGAVQHGLATRAGSYLSSNDRRVHFGLGGETTVKLVEVTWPGGSRRRYENVKAGQVLAVARR